MPIWVVHTFSTQAVTIGYPNIPRATCPICRTALNWFAIRPYIVLAEEAKYSPVLSLAATGKDIPPNTPSYRPASSSPNKMDARQRFVDAKSVVDAFFPSGVPHELLVSDVTDFSEPSHNIGCAQQLFNGNPNNLLVDIFDAWRISKLLVS